MVLVMMMVRARALALYNSRIQRSVFALEDSRTERLRVLS